MSASWLKVFLCAAFRFTLWPLENVTSLSLDCSLGGFIPRLCRNVVRKEIEFTAAVSGRAQWKCFCKKGQRTALERTGGSGVEGSDGRERAGISA